MARMRKFDLEFEDQTTYDDKICDLLSWPTVLDL